MFANLEARDSVFPLVVSDRTEIAASVDESHACFGLVSNDDIFEVSIASVFDDDLVGKYLIDIDDFSLDRINMLGDGDARCWCGLDFDGCFTVI